jgi:hypothetical protein
MSSPHATDLAQLVFLVGNDNDEISRAAVTVI